MKSDLSLGKTTLIAIKFFLLAIVGVISTLMTFVPAKAHHPFEGREPELFNSIEGILSGLAHPILGVDHLLFLLSIGLVGTLSITRWIPLLLFSGLLGTLLSWVFPMVIPGLEMVIGISLLVSVLVSKGLIKPGVMLPLIACHGYALGQAMIGAEPTPLMAYLLGLFLSQGIIILSGIIALRNFVNFKNIFVGVFFGSGIVFTYSTLADILGM